MTMSRPAIRSWIGIALLAGSWLFGLSYFYPANLWAWFAAVAAAVVLLGETNGVAGAAAEKQGRWSFGTIALVLLLPVVWYAAWPYRIAPLLVVLGLAVERLPVRKPWADKLAQGAMTAGVVLFVQMLALELYASHTACSHELPWPLPNLLAGIATLLGMDATADGSNVVIYSMRQPHRLGATWELFFDPATFLFFLGGAVWLALRGNVGLDAEGGERKADGGEDAIQHSAFSIQHSSNWSPWIRESRTLALVVVAWLPLRAGLLMGLYLHRVLRSDPDRPLHAMNHFFSPWVLLLLLIVPVLLAWRFVGAKKKDDPCEIVEDPSQADAPVTPVADVVDAADHPSFGPRHLAAAAGLVALAVALFTAAIYWDPVGTRREGRVMVVERHSTWEPTTKAYDTTWYGEPAGYNYAAIYDYLGQYYQMSRLLEKDKIDEQTLAGCDVLVIKTPTARYSPDEVKAVLQFVEQGGGLLLIGDHTNIDRMGTTMNDIARRMGFIFRDDLLFGFGDSPYDQHYEFPATPHPIVQHLPPMDFAVSCSIDPGYSRGRAAVANTGLWSMGPDYHADNYHPVPQHCPEMRYGAFVQVWAAPYGRGRAVAFTDSTIFSNFCVFQPGKAEMMLGMVEWLNHAAPPVNPRPWLLLLGLVPLALGLWKVRGRPQAWLVLLAAGACGWVVASTAVTAAQRWAMPTPQCVRSQMRVVIDRNISNAPLSEGPDTTGNGAGYGLLEQWIPRLGCYTVREKGAAVFSGNALVVICPERSVSDEFREQITNYVHNGGKLLVIDSPENTSSTANSLLWPFGLSIHHDRAWKGQLSTTTQLPMLDVTQANEVVGGTPVAKLDKLPVIATAKYGDGAVMAIGCGSLWNDKRMGEHWMLEPNATVKARYNVLFALLELILEDKPLPGPPAEGPKKPAADLPMQESGPAEL